MTEVVVVGSANLDLVVEVDTIPLVGETVLGGDLRRAIESLFGKTIELPSLRIRERLHVATQRGAGP